MAGAVPQPTARLIFRTWDGDADAALAAGLWGDSRVTELIGGPFDEAGENGCRIVGCDVSVLEENSTPDTAVSMRHFLLGSFST